MQESVQGLSKPINHVSSQQKMTAMCYSENAGLQEIVNLVAGKFQTVHDQVGER